MRELFQIGTSRSEQMMLDILRRLLKLPPSFDLQAQLGVHPNLVVMTNDRYGTKFHHTRIFPDACIPAGTLPNQVRALMIEYDGYYHQTPVAQNRDKAKNDILLGHDESAILCRIRDGSFLPALNYATEANADRYFEIDSVAYVGRPAKFEEAIESCLTGFTQLGGFQQSS